MTEKELRPKVGELQKGVSIAIRGLQVRGDWTKDYYFNHINVSHSPWDFSMRFGLISMPTEMPQKSEGSAFEIEVKTDMEIKFPVNLLPGLIRALEDQRRSYEEEFGSIVEPKTKAKE